MPQTHPPLPAKETLPTMYDLSCEDPEEPGLPDEFHLLQTELLRLTFQPPNHPNHLAQSIHDAGWSLFTQWLDDYGRIWDKVVVAVPPQYTTQASSDCGHPVVEALSTRTHRCPRCGSERDRDLNAVLNILREGLSSLGMEEQNGTHSRQRSGALGHWETGPQGRTIGETGTAAVAGQPETVSAVAEPITRIPALTEAANQRADQEARRAD
ncbi:zinc ribbon domain-containing protein [Trichothermofontia sp.]